MLRIFFVSKTFFMRQSLSLFGGGTSRPKSDHTERNYLQVCEVSLKLWTDSRKCCTVQKCIQVGGGSRH